VAKRTYGHEVSKVGKSIVVSVVEGRGLTKDQQKSLNLIGWTAGPKNKREKFWRNLVG
jgi:hypothetical protein